MRIPAIAAVLLLIGACAGPRVAASLPPVTVRDLDGKAVRFEPTGRGRPLLLVFFMPWCAACRHEAPVAEALRQRLGDRLEVVGVSGDEQVAPIRAFVADLGLGYPVWHDPDLALATACGVDRAPTLVLVGADGRVLARSDALDVDLRRAIDEAVGRRP